MSQGFRHTTNNRMELLAVITGLEAITKKELPAVVYSDSQYVVKAIEEGWLKNWMKTNFKGGKKNKDLWTRYFHLTQKISFHPVLKPTFFNGFNHILAIGINNYR